MGTGWIIVIVIIVIIGIVYAIVNTVSENKLWEEGFAPSKTIMGINDSYAFAVDDVGQKIRILVGRHYCRTILFSDVIGVEIIEDNKIYSKKSTTRTIWGALIGGVIAGGVGAIVGGLSGGTTAEKKVSSVQVAILVQDINNPRIIIDCFKANTMSNNLYKTCVKHANQIKDTISVIIDMVDSQNENMHASSKRINTIDIADQLEKLYLLKEKGALSEDEYVKQKHKILS